MTYLGFKVGSMRKKLGVEYPAMYADRSEAAGDKNKLLFNCYQRGHQNALESYPQFLAFLLIGGIKYPVS